MAINADLYYSIRSPYSYIGLTKLDRLLPEQPATIEVTLKPVLPIAVRRPEIFRNASPMALRYLEADTRRAAEMYGIDFRIWPVPDPIVQDMETLEIAAEQPYIYRLTRLMQYACEQGVGYEFILRLATLIWDGKTDDWQQGDHVAKVAASVGLSPEDMETAIASDPDKYDSAVQANQASLISAGHWGVPTIVYNGEPFFGQDRIETFLWRVAATT
ncbi:MAG: DsbA family protein [Gammaproteobacteria bacterium]|jgi:2-hydroxychromene-2-carboxylate isomerase